MMRWLQRARMLAAVIGTTAALGFAFGQSGMDAPPGVAKVGDVISLKFRDGPDRQFKVMKVEKQPDGSYLSDLKDTKTGETITLLDRPIEAPVAPPAPPKQPSPVAPKLKPLPNDPLLPPNSQLSKNTSPQPNSSQNSSSTSDQQQDPPKKPSLFSRIFGSKKTPPANANGPTVNSSTSMIAPAMPPAVRPTPGLFPSASPGTSEPPRVLPIQPIGPPTALFPNSSPPLIAPPPTLTPATPSPFIQPNSPIPPAIPMLVPTNVPSPPASQSAPPAPMIPGLPSTPIPPSSMSSKTPSVIQARYSSPVPVAMAQEIQPYVATLRTARAPTARIYALQALAGCRYASSDTVKRVLFHACVSDPCPLVRACCIDELCKLGFYEQAFLAYLAIACEDTSEEVRDSAKGALKKMTPSR